MDSIAVLLKDQSLVRSIKKDGNILFQGEVPRRAIIIRSGIVRAYTITSSGDERIVALYGRGDILPLSWIIGETSNTLFYYDALTDSRLMLVNRQDLISLLDSRPEYYRHLLGYLSKQYTALLLRITGLEQSRAVEKIGFTLYYLLFRYGQQVKPGLYRVDLKISQTIIASLVGLTRESTTKNLKILKQKSIIKYTNSTYTIDKTKLENFLGEDSFRDLVL